MAQVEPMDIDAIESDFDNKENAFQLNNVVSRTPCTEKGYEELDVSELNMKLWYSVTPASSPMSKSLTGPCLDNRSCNSEDYLNNATGTDNGNLTRSLNSTLTKTEGLSKSKNLPLQTLSSEPFIESNQNSSMRRMLDKTDNNVIISVKNANELDDDLSLPSPCSSVPDTPEATTPTKEIPKPEGSPIMRGLKSVLSMFRPSQSPILPAEDKSTKEEMLGSEELKKSESGTVKVSIPVAESKQKDPNLSQRSSPLKESLVFNDDLEKELLWKDETTIIFKDERIPVHKLFLLNPITLNTSVEHMDISCDESVIVDKSITANIEKGEQSVNTEPTVTGESDNEFLDCETTFTKNECSLSDNKNVASEIQIKGDVTIDLADQANVLNQISQESQNVSKNSICVSSGDKNVCGEEPNDSPKIYINNNIIEATTNFLSSERIYYDEIMPNVDLKNKFETNKESQSINSIEIVSVSESVNENVHPVKATDAQHLESLNVIVNENFNDLNCENNEETEGKLCRDITKLTEKCEIYNNDQAGIIEDTHNIDAKESTDETTIAMSFSSDNEIINSKYNNVIGHELNIDKPHQKQSLQCLDLISNASILTNNEQIELHSNDNMTNIDNINSFNISNVVQNRNLFKDKPSTVENAMHILKDSTFVERQNSSSTADVKVIYDEHDKTVDNEHASLKLESDPETRVDNIIPPSIEDLVNPTIPSITSNATVSVNINSDIPETCDIEKANNSYMTNIVGNQIEPPLENKLENNLEIKVNENESNCDVISTHFVADEVSLYDRDVHIDTDISKSPLEIPLPDEDDSEQNVLERNTSKQDITNFKICELNSDMDAKNKIFMDDQSKITINIMKENHPDIENTEITMNEVPLCKTVDSQTCITQSDGVNVIRPETVDSEDVVNKVLEDEVPKKMSCIIEPTLNTENYGDNLYKPECTNITDDDDQRDFTNKRIDEIDEEIITSANNSPYVSITDLDKVVENSPNKIVEEIDIPLSTNNLLETSPSSPKIISKGYNLNFDEIDDPFATKINIRMSPTPDTVNDSFKSVTKKIETLQKAPKGNRRKSEPLRKRPINKKNMNSTLSEKSSIEKCTTEKPIDSTITATTDKDPDNVAISHVKDITSESKHEDYTPTNAENVTIQEVEDSIKSDSTANDEKCSSDSKEENQFAELESKIIDQTLVISTEKSTSSSEQYFSLGTSSGESSSVMNRSKNVFNLPELDDVNFNPFASKSKIRLSPPPAEKRKSLSDDKNCVTNLSFILNQQPSNNTTITKDPDVTLEINNENNTLSDYSNTTLSSKNTHDIDITVKEILTEDEDTVEGPFLELDDVKDNEKVSDMGTDMMHFEEKPQQERDENLENGELFIDADAFEFLLNQNKSTTVSDSGKESLFLKFDPLFAKRASSDGILAALNEVQNRQSTPKKMKKPKEQNIMPVEKCIPGPSNIEKSSPVEEVFEDLLSNVTKPMMVVNPAVSSVMTQKKPVTPKFNRRSVTFTSPAMAVIDRLLSLSGNSSHLAHDTSVSHTRREHSETDLAITQLRELLAEKEINVHTLRSESKELEERLASLEVQVRGLEKESAERLAKINELNERLSEKTKINKSMAIVVEEYERTIASLIAETEHDKKRNAEERMKLIKERDEQTAHLTSMEVSFSDLHSKYEKSKQIILSYKANEDVYKKSLKEFQDNFAKMQNNYELLKQHATSKLNHANQELEKMNRAHEAEVLKMNAMIKRKELHITSLEETLAQKTKANEELTAICDELINKVG